MRVGKIMKRILLTITTTILPALVIMMTFTAVGHAKIKTQKNIEKSKNMAFTIKSKKIDRVATLEAFFDKYNSPLKGSSQTFVEVADRYNIEYTLLPSIACMESTCGKFMPYQSNNAFGWGVYGGNHISFASHDEAIEVVGEGLNKGYFSKGFDTIPEIAPIYTPPNHVNWKNGVSFFSNQITDIALDG